MDVDDGPGVYRYFCGLNSCNPLVRFWAPLTVGGGAVYGYINGVYYNCTRSCYMMRSHGCRYPRRNVGMHYTRVIAEGANRGISVQFTYYNSKSCMYTKKNPIHERREAMFI